MQYSYKTSVVCNSFKITDWCHFGVVFLLINIILCLFVQFFYYIQNNF